MDFSLLIINILAGSLVGYVTKSLAINMLFKKYPIIGGAEIIKDRKNLAKAISVLVEERLIKPSTLLEEFQKEEFRESFERLLHHIVSSTISQNIKEMDTLGKISGFHQTLANLKAFLLRHQDEILRPGLDILYKHVLIEDILSPEQMKHGLEKGVPILTTLLEAHLETFWQQLLAEIGPTSLDQWVSREVFLKVGENLIPDDLPDRLEEHLASHLDSYLDTCVEWLQIFPALEQAELRLKEKPLGDLLQKVPSEQAAPHLLARFQMFLQSPKGRALSRDFLGHGLDILKTLDVPLSDLVTPAIESRILQLIQAHMPDLLSRLEDWVATNKVEMEEMINEAVEAHLKSESLIKQMVGNLFARKLAEKYHLVETTLEDLKAIAQESAPNMIAFANRLLANTTISTLVTYLDTHWLDRDALADTALELVARYLGRLDLSLLEPILATRLKDIPGLGQISLANFCQTHVYGPLKNHLKAQILFHPNLSQHLRALLPWLWPLAAACPVKALLPPEHAPAYRRVLLEVLDSGEFRVLLEKLLAEEIPALLHGKSVDSVVTANIKQEIYDNLSSLYRTKIDNVLQALNQEKIKDLHQLNTRIYQDLSTNRLFAKQMTDTLLGLMVRLIRDNHLLDGKIQMTVEESFVRFSDEELKQEMDSFMGKELQPIKMLGAFLGAGVGIVMWYLSLIPGWSTYVTGYWALLSYSFSYAISEVGTNWLALKMLFRPYYPLKLPGLPFNLPFTPGIFPKNKKALADSLVDFVDKKLLSKDNMVAILEKYQHTWKKVIKGVTSHNDYQVIDKTLQQYTRDNYDTLTPLLLDLGFKELNRNKQEVACYLLEEVNRLDLESREFKRLQQEIALKIDDSRTPLTRLLAQTLSKPGPWQQQTLRQLGAKSAAQALEPWQTWHITQLLAQSQALLTGQVPLGQALSDLLQQLAPLLSSRLDQVIDAGLFQQDHSILLDYLESQLQQERLQNALLDRLGQGLFTGGVSSDKSLGELFDGKLIAVALRESDAIMDSLSHYLLNMARNKKGDLVKIVLSDIETHGVVEFLMVSFGGIHNDIRGVVDVMVERKLGPYLDHKKEELKDLFQAYVQHKVSSIRIAELGLQEEIFNIATIRSLVRTHIFNNQPFLALGREFLGAVLEDLGQDLTLKDLLASFQIHTLADLSTRFQDELTTLKTLIARQMDARQPELVAATRDLWNDLADKTLYDRSLADLSQGFCESELQAALGPIMERFYGTEAIQTLKADLLRDFFRRLNTHLADLLNREVLSVDLMRAIDRLTDIANGRRHAFQQAIQTNLRDITFTFVDVLNATLEKETKEVIEDVIVTSLVDSLRANNRAIVEPIDFEAIVRQEVAVMEPARIESLFDFAKPIFRLLIWYGSLGGIIGMAVGFFEALR